MSTCKECGTELVWGRTESGLKVALDANAPVYDLAVFDVSKGDYRITRSLTCRVAHRSLCPGKPARAAGGKAGA